jgi:Dyp-type peroxidase family
MIATETRPAPKPVSTDEPILELNEIQGNSLGGFHKDHEMLMFLKITDVTIAKKWLTTIAPSIATAAEVLQFNKLFKETRKRRGKEGTVRATFINIGFSFDGLKKLTPDADQFTDEAFKEGLHNRSAALGDPTDPKAPGHPNNWLIGGTNNVPDVVLIIASDDRDRLDQEVKWLTASLKGVKLMYKERGETLPGVLAGHEHFGFKDGISQPGIRGRISETEFLTPRENPEDENHGKPGQDLLHAGEFIFGYPTQIGEPDRDENGKAIEGLNIKPGEIATAGPAWSTNGSYLVFRRLRQDVKGFHAFLKATAAMLSTENPAFAGMTPEKLGAKLVGRWASGAPIVKAPDQDNPALANDLDFEFEGEGDDIKGFACPFAGHIRKTYPRDTTRPLGSEDPFINESATQTHRLLRRGIPFGKAILGGCPMKSLTSLSGLKAMFQRKDKGDRGLLFLAYQTSIVRQFEFVSGVWMNNTNFPPNLPPAVPPEAEPGHDAILGQSTDPATRDRTITLQAPGQNSEVKLPTDWVIPTGGGYFFSPSISALEHLAQ